MAGGVAGAPAPTQDYSQPAQNPVGSSTPAGGKGGGGAAPSQDPNDPTLHFQEGVAAPGYQGATSNSQYTPPPQQTFPVNPASDMGMVGPGYQGATSNSQYTPPPQQTFPVNPASDMGMVGPGDGVAGYTDNDHMPGFANDMNPQGSMTPAGGKGGGGMMQPAPYQNPQGSSTPAGGKGGGGVMQQPQQQQQNYYQPPLLQQPYQSQPQQGYGNAYAQPYQQRMQQQYGGQQVQQVGYGNQNPYQQQQYQSQYQPQYQQPFNESQRYGDYMSGILGGMPRQQFSSNAVTPASQSTGNITSDRQSQFNAMMDAYNQAHSQDNIRDIKAAEQNNGGG